MDPLRGAPGGVEGALDRRRVDHPHSQLILVDPSGAVRGGASSPEGWGRGRSGVSRRGAGGATRTVGGPGGRAPTRGTSAGATPTGGSTRSLRAGPRQTFPLPYMWLNADVPPKRWSSIGNRVYGRDRSKIPTNLTLRICVSLEGVDTDSPPGPVLEGYPSTSLSIVWNFIHGCLYIPHTQGSRK